MLPVEFGGFPLVFHAHAVQVLPAGSLTEEVQYPLVAPQRIVESAHGDEIIELDSAVEGLTNHRHLAVDYAYAAPHHVGAGLDEVYIGLLQQRAERADVGLRVDVDEELGRGRQALYQAAKVLWVGMGRNQEGKLGHIGRCFPAKIGKKRLL